MIPEEALVFIYNTSTLAPVPKARHTQCEQAINILIKYLKNSELKKSEEEVPAGKNGRSKSRIPGSSKKKT